MDSFGKNNYQTAEQRLLRNEVLAKHLDLLVCAVMLAIPVATISAGFIHLWGDPRPVWVRAAGAFIAGMVLAYPGVKLVALLGRSAAAKLAPTWVVDASEPHVVIIKGAVPYTQWDAARSAVLKARPGYAISDDARREYGGVLVAIPCKQ